jgi:acetoin utilization protein AcuB
MTPFPYSIDVGGTIIEAGKLMQEHGIRHLPVKDGGELVGVVSERDLRVVIATRDDLAANAGITVGTVCRMQPYVVDISEPLALALREMAVRHISSALVVKQGKLVGILTATDACKVLASLLDELAPSGDDVA